MTLDEISKIWMSGGRQFTIEFFQSGFYRIGDGDGVVILTDMFGGTPSNLAYSFLDEGRVEVLAGVNLPILIKAIDSRPNMKLTELATSLEKFGRRSITLASGVLKGSSGKR